MLVIPSWRPGTSELGMVRTHNIPRLEKYFTVVVWDQRGAGMSHAMRKPESGMRVEQFIADAHELTQLLCRRFKQPKIYLVGHSWGSALGVLTEHPAENRCRQRPAPPPASS